MLDGREQLLPRHIINAGRDCNDNNNSLQLQKRGDFWMENTDYMFDLKKGPKFPTKNKDTDSEAESPIPVEYKYNREKTIRSAKSLDTTPD
jgi:hypothetical protein